MLRLVLPMIIALVAAFAATRVQRRLRPDWATWTLTVLAVGSALAVTWALLVLAAGYAAELPALSAVFGWCTALFSSHDRIPAPLGIAAWAALAAMAASAVLRLRARRAALKEPHDDVIASMEPLAFALPGNPGRVIVSTGMLEQLNHSEQRVLYAHERSHLRHNHHRFLHLSETAAAALPILRPITDQVRFATERWADEDAVNEVGDRRLVARAIARAAVAASTAGAPSTAMALTGSGSRARVEALLEPPHDRRGFPAWVAFGVTGLGISLASSTVQFHHLVEFLSHICGVG